MQIKYHIRQFGVYNQMCKQTTLTSDTIRVPALKTKFVIVARSQQWRRLFALLAAEPDTIMHPSAVSIRYLVTT